MTLPRRSRDASPGPEIPPADRSSTVISSSTTSPTASSADVRPPTAAGTATLNDRLVLDPKPYLLRRLSAQTGARHPENGRPGRHHNWKSSNAVPTVSTASARSSGTATASSSAAKHLLPTFWLGGTLSMTTHNGVNPHSAADMLRQAIMQK